MNKKQIIAFIAPVLLLAMMFPIFRVLAGVMNDRIAWYIGLIIYWLIWGLAFPLIIVGRENILALIRPQKPSMKAIIFVAIPLVFTLIGRFAFGMIYESEIYCSW
jgi:hypothetical protein